MKNIIKEWVGKKVHVTLRHGIAAPTLEAKLLLADESGVLLELPKGRTFVPVTSILHVSLLARDVDDT